MEANDTPHEDGTLHIEERGAGSPVVLVHGMPSAPEDFQGLAEALERRHRVLVPHMPGYGRTAPERGPYRLDAVIARLEKGLLDRQVTEAALVAFSAGAYKAVALALSGRIRVNRMVLMAPVVGLDPPIATAYRELVAAVRAGAADPRATWLDRMASPGLAARDPAAAARVLAWLDAASYEVMCDELVALADAVDLRPRLTELECPALVCAGAADPSVPLAWAQDVTERLRRGKLERFEGIGHGLFVEAPAALEQLIVEFLSSGAT